MCCPVSVRGIDYQFGSSPCMASQQGVLSTALGGCEGKQGDRGLALTTSRPRVNAIEREITIACSQNFIISLDRLPMHGSPIQRQNRSSGSMIDQEIDSQARDPKN
eukprot:COSAG01_NODE_11049_length_2020_cov_6.391983_1_plen_105_part_10